MWARCHTRLETGFLIFLVGCATAPTSHAPAVTSASAPQRIANRPAVDDIELVQFEANKEKGADLRAAPSELIPEPKVVLDWQLTSTDEAATGEPYDLPTLLDLASASNPTLQQANLQISATLAQAQQAGLYPNPSLTYLGENIGVEGTAGEFQGAELEQRFVTAGKLELSRNKYLQRAEVAEHFAVMQQFKVCNDVKLHFIAGLEAQSLLELQQELLKTAEDRLVMVKELHNLGQANEVDIRKANADLRRHQLQLLSAENRVRQTFLDLTSVVGIELAYRPLNGTLDKDCRLIQFDEACNRLITESPEILAAYSKLQEDHLTVHREQVEWVPDIVVSGGSGYNFEARDEVANAMVRIELPLYDRNQGTILQAQNDEQRQRLEIRRVEMTLRHRLAAEYDRYLTALQKVENYRETVLPELRSAYEQSLKSYREDRQEWPEVLDTHTEYTTRRIEHVHNLRELSSAEVLITGFLLKGGLDAAPSPTPPGHIDSTPKPR